jgi:hypothetical protein
LVNFSRGGEKKAKNSYGSFPTEFVREVKSKNEPRLVQFLLSDPKKELENIFQKAGGQNVSFGLP